MLPPTPPLEAACPPLTSTSPLTTAPVALGLLPPESKRAVGFCSSTEQQMESLKDMTVVLAFYLKSFTQTVGKVYSGSH